MRSALRCFVLPIEFLLLLAIVWRSDGATALGFSGNAADSQANRQAHASTSTHNDISPALRSLPSSPPALSPSPLRIGPRPAVPTGGVETSQPLPGGDPLVRSGTPLASMPSPLRSFEGISDDDQQTAFGFRPTPPDTNGDVGPNHYVQWVNVSIAIYDKNGTRLLGPLAGNRLWSGFGGLCETTNHGDGIVLYDRQADRWLLYHYAFSTPSGFPTPPYYLCLAISQTPDPTGAFYRYSFLYSSTVQPDFGAVGIWPDAYYLAVHQAVWQGSTATTGGPGAVALERAKMLNGLPAGQIVFDLYSEPQYQGLVPSHLTSSIVPATGSPNYFVRQHTGQSVLQIFEFHVDWTSTANASFTGPTILPTAAIDTNLCNGSLDCLPQPAVAQKLDAGAPFLLHRLPYRNFGDHESLAANVRVDVDGTDHAGIRWYELRKSSSSGWVLYQQGTFAPDSDHRWMGSIAMDRSGNMAVGYSVSSTNTFPSLRYAGRLASDALGSLAQGETTLMAGAGAQTGSNRWGDYSAMSIDPTDDCTFWFTSEYYPATGANVWHTRIGAFRFPGCGSLIGDLNGDGIVDIRDYGIWRQNFGATDCGNVADINLDCIVDIRDYGIWRQNFGLTAPNPSLFFVDMGVPTSEAGYNLQGWDGTQGPPDNTFVSPTGDRTKRYQILRGDNSLTFSPASVGHSYRVTAEVENGGCIDSFQVLANGTTLFTFNAQPSIPTVIRSHVVDIPASVVTSSQIVVTFRNTAPDTCGTAAVYNVKVQDTAAGSAVPGGGTSRR